MLQQHSRYKIGCARKALMQMEVKQIKTELPKYMTNITHKHIQQIAQKENCS